MPETTKQGPAYRIETKRLVIRCWNPADAPLLIEAVQQSLDHLLPWMPWAKYEPVGLEQRIEWLRGCRARFDRGEDFVYAIFNRDESQVLGGTGLHSRLGAGAREIGYWIHKHYINQGLATETSAALTKVGFEIEKINRIEIHCDPENVRSAAVPRKLGFSHEATLRQRIQNSYGEWRDSMIWTLLAENYPSSPAAAAEIQAFDAVNRLIIFP